MNISIVLKPITSRAFIMLIGTPPLSVDSSQFIV